MDRYSLSLPERQKNSRPEIDPMRLYLGRPSQLHPMRKVRNLTNLQRRFDPPTPRLRSEIPPDERKPPDSSPQGSLLREFLLRESGMLAVATIKAVKGQTA